MNVVKICFSNINFISGNINALFQKLANEGYVIHIQHLDNSPYLQWLVDMNTMDWYCIVNIYVEYSLQDSIEVAKYIVEQLSMLQEVQENVDVYVATQMVYKKPVNHAEVITSCYFWNFENEESVRNHKMAEHFLMEQKQHYYDYVAFQCVQKCVTEYSQPYNFFFESHVSNPEGINAIYSNPVLGNMRIHSQTFLNVTSRLLTFGRVEIIDRKTE